MGLFNSIRNRWILWVWTHTPHCREMARLASQAQERRLPLKIRWQIRLHHRICVWCARYQQQLDWMHRRAPHLREAIEFAAGRGLSPDARHRILEHLREHRAARPRGTV